METIKFGLIGAGQIAGYSAIEINKHSNAKVIAAYDVSESRTAMLCEAHQIEHAYSSVEALLADTEVDAVYIAVPNKFHEALAIQALEAGKHVVLEKPVALSYAEAKAIADTAEAQGKVLSIGMNQRFEEGSQIVKSLVDNNVLGEIYHAKAYWQRREGIPKMGTWFGNKELAGGGALYDIGVHLLDLSLYAMGNYEPVSVTGVKYTQFGNRGLGAGGWGMSDSEQGGVFDVDDFASAMIRFSNGASITLDVSWACHMETDERLNVELFGTEAGASVYPAKLYRRDPLRKEYTVITDPNAKIAYPHGNRFHNFINHVLEGEPLCVTVEQALMVQRILDAIYQSCEEGREVSLQY